MAQVKVNRITNAAIHLDGGALLGQVEEFDLPEIKFKDSDHKALGMIGTPAFISGIDKLEGRFKWTSFYDDVLVKVANPYKSLKVQVRGHLESWDASGNIANTKVVAYMTIAVSSFPKFGFKQNDNVEAESPFKVYYYKLQIGTRIITEIDILSNIHKVDGVDLLADYRANLGI